MTTQKTQTFNVSHMIIIVLLIINIIVSIRSGQQTEKLEIMKVGGQANWEKLQIIMNNDVYKQQYSQNFEMLLEQLNAETSGITSGFEEEVLNESINNSEQNMINNEEFVSEDNMIDDTINEIDSNEFN